jgi:hypothetical protein
LELKLRLPKVPFETLPKVLAKAVPYGATKAGS